MTPRTARQVIGAAKELARLRLRGTPFPPVAPSYGRNGVFIGASNSAGQGWGWARSLERAAPGIRAVSARFEEKSGTEGFAFRVDQAIYSHYAAHSTSWQRKQLRTLQGYGAVIIESGGSILSRAFGDDAYAQANVLRESGVKVALLFHGSDIREPDPHMSQEPHSHFAVDTEFARLFRETTARNRELIEKLNTRVFVSTPDLLSEVPGATWLPVVVDVERWAVKTPPLQSAGLLRVAHVPSSSMVKGTELIEPLLRDLTADGWIDYRAVHGLPHAEMPAVYGSADVVVDQFRVGNYGVAACEALAAGRIVVSHVSQRVREKTLELTGEELPIVEATPESLGSVLVDIRENPRRYRELAAQGPAFVRAHHDGTRSGAVLSSWLGESHQS